MLKRKRAEKTAEGTGSPAPSEPPEVLLTSRGDLSTRPVLNISRGPSFIPIAESETFFKTDNVGINRHGFRYSPAGINPKNCYLPCRTIESNPCSYRISWEDRSSYIYVSKDGLKLLGSKGFRSARGNAPIREGKWYMEVKILRGGGEHSSEDSRRDGSHVRLGFGRREAPLNGPVGLDGYSYGYRDKTGEKVTLSRPRPYGREYHSGDVIGMYISLPPKRQPDPKDPNDPARLKRERIAIDLKGQEMFESLEYPQSKEMIALMDYSGKPTETTSLPSSSNKTVTGKLPERTPANAKKVKDTGPTLRPLPTLPESRIAFFVNGECQGIAFQDLYDYLQLRATASSRRAKGKRAREGVKEHRENPFDDGTLGYYPFISLFNNASVELNPGPDFAFPPPPDIDAFLNDPSSPNVAKVEGAERTWRPTCERYEEFMKEQWELDVVDEEEAKVEATRIAEQEKIEAEKRKQKEKKKQQAEARKRAKLQAAGSKEPSESLVNSPLKHGTSYPPESRPASPALSHTHYSDVQGMQSGYNSETGDAEMDNEERGSSVFEPPPSDGHAPTGHSWIPSVDYKDPPGVEES
ncbi:ash2-trithorax family protein [Moniliophthora roreri MCA 2997]|uniref:Ash2-trithorax family protein n=2 Tax=Moniliophthora roreri TaxID=221103 RepID=V2YWJ9_MONRO|nr:ash2-trithorax family protein [Moniliophthora roreri MCA 2997]